MLVLRLCAKVNTTLVAPRKTIWVSVRGIPEEFVSGWIGRVFVAPIITRAQFAFPLFRLHNRWLLELCLAIAAVLIAMDLVVPLGRSEVTRNSPNAIELQCQCAMFHTRESLLSPEFPQRIPNDPIEPLLFVLSPPHDRNDVIGWQRETTLRDTTGIVLKADGVNAARDRATIVYLLHHRVLAREQEGTIVGDCGIWVALKTNTRHVGASTSASNI